MMKLFNDIPLSLREWLKTIAKVGTKPFALILISYFIYTTIFLTATYFPQFFGETKRLILELFNTLLKISELIAIFWFLFRALTVIKYKIQAWGNINHNQVIKIIYPVVNNGIQAVFIILMINLIIPELNLPGLEAEFLEKLAKALLFATFGWIFIQTVNGFEKFILYQYVHKRAHNISVKKIQTQIKLMKKIVLVIGLMIITAAILMIFDSVRQLGLGLLTTAGIVSAFGAFASQQSLGRLFAGLQIAFIQPIRIGDTVIVENELGKVEEISLSYVIVKLWDLRKLILPTDYFTGKPFQNLTKTSTKLLGSVYLYVDHAFPIDVLRTKFYQVIEVSKFWDKNIAVLQVTDMKENSIELRVLVSARNSTLLWDLRCEIREQLIKFMVENYINYMPKTRNLNLNKDKFL